MPRLFVAVWPPADVLDTVAALERPAVSGLRWTSSHQWHVTLRFLGQTELEPVVAALAGVHAAPATAWLGPVVGRFGHRVLHLPVVGLDDVAEAVVTATAGVGRQPEDRPFAGHLTLARVAKGARVDLRPLAGAAVEGSWQVKEVCLVESRLSATGAHYEVVARFPLGG
jgi:RNA 2',3'-cyclic 3'-phosphodiesterase